MTEVLVDTSVWISYFRGDGGKAVTDAVTYLISGNEALVNDIILTELLPHMAVRGERECAEALSALNCPPITTDWTALRVLQETCLRAGINKVGIPDLIIAQEAMRLDVPLFSLDKHFPLIATVSPLRLWPR